MPLYDYRCENGHRYEAQEPFGSPATQPCRRCGSPAQRVLTAPAIAFKGSGWYKTDSRTTSGGAPAGAAKDTNGSAESDSEPSAKSADKPGGKSNRKSKASDSKQAGSKASESSSADSKPGGAGGSASAD